jgi:transcriptional regulator with XRE-family HTH domain
LGMSPARVSQILSSNGPNLTLKTIARIAHALGEDFELVPCIGEKYD